MYIYSQVHIRCTHRLYIKIRSWKETYPSISSHTVWTLTSFLSKCIYLLISPPPPSRMPRLPGILGVPAKHLGMLVEVRWRHEKFNVICHAGAEPTEIGSRPEGPRREAWGARRSREDAGSALREVVSWRSSSRRCSCHSYFTNKSDNNNNKYYHYNKTWIIVEITSNSFLSLL